MNNIGLLHTILHLYKTYFWSWIKTDAFDISYPICFILGLVLSITHFGLISIIPTLANIVFLNRDFMKDLNINKIPKEMEDSFFTLQDIALYTDGFFFGLLLLNLIFIWI